MENNLIGKQDNLIGKAVEVLKWDGIKNGIIAGCDILKGITVVSEEDPEQILFCMLPYKDENSIIDIEHCCNRDYKKKFKRFCNEIIDGYIYIGFNYRIINQKMLHGICPFK